VVTALAGRKCVIAKLGMDAHWRGAILVATGLRDAGMEVVYLGHVTPAELVAVVEQEDAELVGLSSLSGNHLGECRRVLDGLAEAGLDEVTVVVGGTIGAADAARLREMGVGAVYGPGTSLPTIVEGVAALLEARRRRGRAMDAGGA
jgi:methylmalonyl-CoA mutase C-terminal domain/subunit